MPLGKRVQALPGNELLRDLPLELNAVGTLPGHGFHPLKAQLTLSNHSSQTVRPRGALQLEQRIGNELAQSRRHSLAPIGCSRRLDSWVDERTGAREDWRASRQ